MDRELLDEFMKSGGGNVDETLKFLATIRTLRQMKDGVTVVNAKITLGVGETAARVGGRKDVVKALGIEKEIEAFAEEVRPIMEKYSEIVNKKAETYLNGNDPEVTAKQFAEWIARERNF